MQVLSQYLLTNYGINISTNQLLAFNVYENELIKWNKQFNLTAIKDPESIQIKHFLDSLTCLSVLKIPLQEKVIDVGTGAGFPGIPLKIIYPEIKLTLVESVKKKAEFCEHIVDILGLMDVSIIHERIEKVGILQEYREKYDYAIARAVALLPTLVEYLIPLVKIGGVVLAMKGESAIIETQQAQKAIHILGGNLRKLIPVVLPKISDVRYLIVIDKIAGTPQGYPRRIGIPTKRPL